MSFVNSLADKFRRFRAKYLRVRAPDALGGRAYDYVARAIFVIRVHYVCLLYFCLNEAVPLMPRIFNEGTRSLAFPGLMGWLGLFDHRLLFGIMIAAFFLGSAFAAVFAESLAARLGAAVGQLLYYSFLYYRYDIGHDSHAWIFTSFILVFLPNEPLAGLSKSRASQVRFIYVFGAAQFFLFFTYSMNGFWKLAYGLAGADLFRLDSFSMLVAGYMSAWGRNGLLADFVVGNHLIAHLLYLIAIYLQFFSFLAFFRPDLHRPWGGALILFTFASYYIFEINFSKMALLIGVMCLLSPSRTGGATPARIVSVLPMWPSLVALIRVAGRALSKT